MTKAKCKIILYSTAICLYCIGAVASFKTGNITQCLVGVFAAICTCIAIYKIKKQKK